MAVNSYVEWCLLIHDKYIKLILDEKKVWEVRTQELFGKGDRIALGNTASKLIEGYATVADAFVLTDVEPSREGIAYPRSNGSPKVRLT